MGAPAETGHPLMFPGERSGPKCVLRLGRKANPLGNWEPSDACANLKKSRSWAFAIRGCRLRAMSIRPSTHLGPLRSHATIT